MPHAEVMSGPLRRAESGVFAHNVHVEALPSGMDTITLSALESPVAKHRVARSCSFFVTPNDPSVDRKSTRLNSSHSQISYAVFCLKKKRFAHALQALARRLRPAPPRLDSF